MHAALLQQNIYQTSSNVYMLIIVFCNSYTKLPLLCEVRGHNHWPCSLDLLRCV